MEPRADRARDIAELDWQQLRLEDMNIWHEMFGQRVGTFHLERPLGPSVMTSRHSAPWDNLRSSTFLRTAKSVRTSWPIGCAATDLACAARSTLISWTACVYRSITPVGTSFGASAHAETIAMETSSRRPCSKGSENRKGSAMTASSTTSRPSDDFRPWIAPQQTASPWTAWARCGARPSAGSRSDAHGAI